MAFDLDLAERLRARLAGTAGVSERRMFGGLAFLVNGHMAVAASGQGGLLVRCDPARTGTYVTPPHVEPMVMRGREMDGWLRVDAEAVSTARELARWVSVGTKYASSLPPK